MDQMDGKTRNNINDNIEIIKQAFPDAFSEGKVDFEKLQLLLGEDIVNDKEKYSFTWKGKNDAIKIALAEKTGTLRPDKDSSKHWNTTKNLYIEGDNLEVLRTLQDSYRGKVKMIYIDPPYNTGNDSFIYPDNYGENTENYKQKTEQDMKSNPETSGRFHTDWLSMMYPRLKLARNLLKDDGVIFISIDDNEVHNLRKICDEIFGEENFLNEIIVENDSRARPYGSVATTHEYILSYSKSISFIYEELINNDKKFKNYDDVGGFDLYELRNRNIAFNIDNRPNLYYSFWINSNNKDLNGLYEISLIEKDGWIEIFPQESQGVKTVWRWGKEKAKENLNTILFAKEANSETGYQIVKKYRETTYSLNTVWTGKEIKTDKGTLETKALFGKNKYFDFPKPVELLKRLVRIGIEKNDLIIDFFSGSATTAQAVMQLNAEDGGNRKHIMVQLPELTDEKSEAYKAGYKNICEVGKERIRRAGEKILEENKYKEGIENLDVGFKVFKLDTTNLKKWETTVSGESDKDIQLELGARLTDMTNSVKEDREQIDMIYEIMLKNGMDLSLPMEELDIGGKKVFSIASGYLIACLENDITLDIVKEICELKPKVTVFYDNSFKDDMVKLNAIEQLEKQDIQVRVI